MVRIDGCVQVWGVAGLYLGPEIPAKLLPARVFPAVSRARSDCRSLMCGPQSTGPTRQRSGVACGRCRAQITVRGVVYSRTLDIGTGRSDIFNKFGDPDLGRDNTFTDIQW